MAVKEREGVWFGAEESLVRLGWACGRAEVWECKSGNGDGVGLCETDSCYV